MDTRVSAVEFGTPLDSSLAIHTFAPNSNSQPSTPTNPPQENLSHPRRLVLRLVHLSSHIQASPREAPYLWFLRGLLLNTATLLAVLIFQPTLSKTMKVLISIIAPMALVAHLRFFVSNCNTFAISSIPRLAANPGILKDYAELAVGLSGVLSSVIVIGWSDRSRGWMELNAGRVAGQLVDVGVFVGFVVWCCDSVTVLVMMVVGMVLEGGCVASRDLMERVLLEW